MLFKDVGRLIAVEIGGGGPFKNRTETVTEVFLNKKSVRQGEFYTAIATGTRLEAMFEVRSIDYSGQTELEHDGKRYKVFRAYDRGEITELVCRNSIGD